MNCIGRWGIRAAIVLLGVSSAALSGTAQEPPTFGWTGFHLDAGGGFGVATHNAGFQLYENLELPYESLNPDRDVRSIGAAADFGGMGDLWSVGAGFDIQAGRIVIGILGDYTNGNINTEGVLFGAYCTEDPGSADDCDTATITNAGALGLTATIGESATVGARVGFLTSPRTLFYGLAGFSWNELTVTGTLDSILSGLQEISTEPLWLRGFYYGVGIETLLTPNMSLRLEFRGTRFAIAGGDGDESFGIEFYDNVFVHAVRGTLSYRLGSERGSRFADGAFNAEEVSWTGLYMGVAGGIGFANHNLGFEAWDYTSGGVFSVGGATFGVDVFSIGASIDLGARGEQLSVIGGFDVELGNRLVVGLLGDYTFSTARSTVSALWFVCFDDPAVCNTPLDPLMPEPNRRVDLVLATGNSVTLAGRIGMLTGPRTLLYALGGYSRYDMAVTATFYEDGVPTSEVFSTALERSGITFGGGIEAMLSHNLSLTLEYRGTLWAVDELIAGDAVDGFRVWDQSYVQTIRAGLSWRIGAKQD